MPEEQVSRKIKRRGSANSGRLSDGGASAAAGDVSAGQTIMCPKNNKHAVWFEFF